MKKLLTILLLFSAVLAKAQTPVVSFTLTQPPCNNDGILTANFTNVTLPVTATWQVYYGGVYTTIIHAGLTTPSDVLTGYSGASIYLNVTDASNNVGSGYYSHLPFNYNVSNTFPTCPAQSVGTVTVSGGTSPYTYQWFNKATHAIVGTGNPVSLPNGQYGITITDANGCVTGSDYGYDSVNFYSIPSFSVSVSHTTASCTNGTATIAPISGGTAPYSYLWSNGATSSALSGLSMGTYTVTVTDATGCTNTGYAYVPQSVYINTNTTITPATCTQNNGAITSFGSGGVAPYTYLYGNGATTQTITNLVAGAYGVVIKDANGCIGTNSATVTASTPITATYAATPSSCTSGTGSATLTITGGAAPYTVSWATYPAQTGVTASNLPAGNYAFHITDANGCVRAGTATIPPLHTITVAFSTSLPTCTQANGSISVTASGGTTPYTYSWSNGGTTASISSVAANGYDVTIQDNAGCHVTKGVLLDATSPVTIGISSTPASCIFTADGDATATATGGTSPYTYNWSNGQSTGAITNLLQGNYYVSVTDAAGCTANNYTVLGYNASNNSCYCTISGHVYQDLNANCTQDPGEPGIQNIQMHCSGNIGYTYTDANGYYSFIVPSGTYTISQKVLTTYPLQSCQSNAVSVTASAAANCTHTVDFADSVNPVHDMHISLWNNTFPIPGFGYDQICIVNNSGTVAEAGIQASYATDGQLNGATFYPASIFTGTSNLYQSSGFPTLQPGATEVFDISYNVPANIPLNTSLLFKDTAVYTSPLSGWLNDYTPWNNVNYFTTPVVGAYDPNFKAVSPQGDGPTGIISYTDSTLEYMVHFQNTGTYMAQNIVVLDTLDANLDWTTLTPVYESNPCVVTLNNGVARFAFNNVDLPAQVNDKEGSNGMFTYTVKLKKNLALGTQIKNSASIYFDYNRPIVTNSTLNTLGKTSSVNTVTAQGYVSFFVYPNPASGNCSAIVDSKENNTQAYLNITDLTGKIISSKELILQKGTQTIAIDGNRLAPGIYIASLTTGSQTQTQKLVIIK